MKSLSPELRRQLERTVVQARNVAEAGARAALEALAVHHHEPYGHMSSEQRTLRRRLRAHARQLGDRLDVRSGSHGIDHLVHECAYEHWHGMLFARFLAENHLLIEPEMTVAISLEECEELAKEESIDKWALAARFAHQMLPQMFRPDHPVFEVQYAREHRLKLEDLVESLPPDVFTAMDSLGWVYQFWQAQRKKEVNEAGKKIGADEISAVTQLFTEDYMVEFLLHNTFGAWWAGKRGPINAVTEDEARVRAVLPAKNGLPAIPWTYLRFIQDEETQTWKPAAGTFDGWPQVAKDITFLDPCMGSGHFPVFALPILARIRMEEENLSAAHAIVVVLRDNLRGLELDPRCTQIGAFNIAVTAWKLGGHQTLPPLHVACCGLAPQAKLADWLKLAGDNDKLRRGMERLHKLFTQAPVLGSLINPRLGGDLIEAGFDELAPLLERALADERADETTHELAVTAQGISKAAEILAGKFTLVATNVPFLKRGYQAPVLGDWLEANYEDGKANLATAFLIRSLEFCEPAGSISIVIQQSWLYQKTQQRLRERVLSSSDWSFVARLGPGAFGTITGEVVNVALVCVSNHVPTRPSMLGLDAYKAKTPEIKNEWLRTGQVVEVEQKIQLRNPQATFVFPGTGESLVLLGNICDLGKGSVTGDSPHFIRQFWEQPLTRDWRPWLNTPENSLYSGRHQVVFWQSDGRLVSQEKGARIHGQNVWGNSGVLIGKTSFSSGIYCGEMFDDNTGVLSPTSADKILSVLSFCESEDFEDAVRDVDQELKVTIGNFGKVSFDLDKWQDVAAEKYPDGFPKPHSDDPTQWLFNGHLQGSERPLHVAVARLLGYRWPRQTGSSFSGCPALGPDGLESYTDKDGIVCIPSVRGEPAAHERLLHMLEAAWSDEWTEGTLAKLLAGTGTSNIDDWLRNQFFEQHCKLFHHRPFIWHIWDGRKRDGFHALVNYHKLAEGDGKGRRLLESLTYSYLGDWISRQQDGVKRGEGGAEDRLAAALELQKRLVAIIEGEPPFDIFVRWKPIEEQPIGWEPDINDGVHLNIRPFMAQDIPGGKRGAGILRAKPNVHWKKDRGKEPMRDQAQFPWFWNNDKFTSERVNDVHLTNAEKKTARERAEGKPS